MEVKEMYKVEETILGYVRKNVPLDDELKKQIIKDGNYRAIKEKYPSIFKGMIKLQEKLIEEAMCNIGRYETGYRPLLDKAIEKKDFEKFYDEVILEIVPDKAPWSQTYLVKDNGFGPLVVERVNPLPEFGLIGEEKYGYIFGYLCLGRRFDKIEADGTFSNAEIGLNCDMVSYFRLVYGVYKGIVLSLEEAIKILQDRGFLTGYSVEELVKYGDESDRLLGYSRRVRNRVKLVYRLDNVEDLVAMDSGDRVALIPYNSHYEAGDFSKIYFYLERDARIFAEKHGLKIVNEGFNLNTEEAIYLLWYRVRKYKELHQGALPKRIRISKAAAEALKDYLAENKIVLGYRVEVDENIGTDWVAVVCDDGVTL